MEAVDVDDSLSGSLLDLLMEIVPWSEMSMHSINTTVGFEELDFIPPEFTTNLVSEDSEEQVHKHQNDEEYYSFSTSTTSTEYGHDLTNSADDLNDDDDMEQTLSTDGVEYDEELATLADDEYEDSDDSDDGVTSSNSTTSSFQTKSHRSRRRREFHLYQDGFFNLNECFKLSTIYEDTQEEIEVVPAQGKETNLTNTFYKPSVDWYSSEEEYARIIPKNQLKQFRSLKRSLRKNYPEGLPADLSILMNGSSTDHSTASELNEPAFETKLIGYDYTTKQYYIHERRKTCKSSTTTTTD